MMRSGPIVGAGVRGDMRTYVSYLHGNVEASHCDDDLSRYA